MKKYVFILGLINICTACQSPEAIKLEQYNVAGYALYQKKCANCHQSDGKGLQNLYPPIASSDFLAENKHRIICALKYGMNDTITVNNQRYSQIMPANDQLEAIDIAEICTYIYTKWGDETTITDTRTVEDLLFEFKKQRFLKESK